MEHNFITNTFEAIAIIITFVIWTYSIVHGMFKYVP